MVFTEDHSTLKHRSKVRVVDDHHNSVGVDSQYSSDQLEAVIDDVTLFFKAGIDRLKKLLLLTILLVFIRAVVL